MTSGKQERVGRMITLESFIIDTFVRIDDDGNETPVDREDEIGGAGTYALIGSRMFLPPHHVGMIIDYEPLTFPEVMDEGLRAYGEDMFTFRQRLDGGTTTRAVNKYHGELRLFDYLNVPILNTPKKLVGTIFAQPPPQIIHFVSLCNRALMFLAELEELKDEGWNPKLFWEPEPVTCHPQYLDLILTLGSQMDVFSPNHTEAFNLLSIPHPKDHSPEILKPLVEEATMRLSQCRPKIATIVRAGPLGCCFVETKKKWEEVEVQWVGAYWQPDPSGETSTSARRPGPNEHDTLAQYEKEAGEISPMTNGANMDGSVVIAESERCVKSESGTRNIVVDPTGAGNAFMGGLAASILLGNSVEEACIWGSVAASFTIEQHGLPHLSTDNGKERWNGEDPMERVEQLRKRTAWEEAM